jgi:hypothetical protein
VITIRNARGRLAETSRSRPETNPNMAVYWLNDADGDDPMLRAVLRGDNLIPFTRLSGSSSAVERQLPKLDVTGSIPVSRSNFSIT